MGLGGGPHLGVFKSGRGLPQSKTWRKFGETVQVRKLLTALILSERERLEDELLAGVVEDDFEFTEGVPADVAGHAFFGGGSAGEETGGWICDFEIAQAKLGEVAFADPGAAADTPAFASGGFARGFEQIVGLDEGAAEAERAGAAGVEFKLGFDRFPIRDGEGGFDDWSFASEFQGDDFARALIVKGCRLVEANLFAVDFDNEPAEETGPKDSVFA